VFTGIYLCRESTASAFNGPDPKSEVSFKLSKPARAVLRNVKGEHLCTLTPDEIQMYEALAEEGKVHRAQKMKKGRLILIFRLTEIPHPDVDPSFSSESSCSLTEGDSQAIAGCFGEITRGQRERWMGWGLVAYA
jgi:hypothetical protein